MLVRLTLPTKSEIFVHCSMVLLVERNLTNPLETAITTNMMTQRGPLIYSVLESPAEVAELINLAPRAELTVLGTKNLIH